MVAKERIRAMNTSEPTPNPPPDAAANALQKSSATSASGRRASVTRLSDTAVQATVIITEPDADARFHVIQALKNAGIRALGLSSLEQTHQFLRSSGGHIRIIVLAVDNIAPDNSELKELLDSTRTSSSAILVYATEAGTQTALHCLSLGAVDFIRKTPDTSDLLAAIRQVQKRQEGGAVSKSHDSGIYADRPMDGWVELTAASDFEYLRRIQRFIALVLAGRLPPDVCDDIRIILEEAGRNAIEWGNRFNTEKTFRISYCNFGDRVILKFEDEGEGFDPKARTNPTEDPDHLAKRAAAGKRPGGYGVHMLHELMDEVVYSEKGNVVVMTKYLDPSACA